MAVTRVTNESVFSRLGKSIGGILGGIIIFLAGIGVLAWNEGRAVKTAKGLKEGAAAVVNADSASVDAANDGKLVHMSGTTSASMLRDDLFPIATEGIKLRRDVEMFQWRENSESQTKTKLGGGTETVTTYTYDKVWSDKPIPSDGFQESVGHQNPGAFPISSTTLTASPVTLGGFRMSPGLVGQMSNFESLPLPDEMPDGFTKSGNTAFRGANATAPEIGDLRVSFEVVRSAEVSVVAQQQGNNLNPYSTKTGTSIELLSYGNVPAADMFAAAQAANTTMTWILRLVGFLMLFGGVCAVFAPLAVVADILPFLGGLVRMGTGFLAAVIAAPTAFITIAIAWVVYRPVLGISLLVLAVAIPVALVALKKKKAPLPA